MPEDINVRITATDGASSVLQQVEKQFGQTARAAGNLSGSLGQLTSAFGLAGAGAVGATTLFAGMAVGLFKLGEELDAASDKLVIMTGASSKALEGLQQNLTDVVATTPTSFGEAAAAIGMFSQRLDLTGAPLTKLSSQMLELSRLTGTDLTSNTRGFTRALQDWQVPASQASDQLDRLFVIGQKTGVSLGELTQAAVFFGAPLRALGFSFEEATALIGKFEKEGVNTTQVLSSLRIGISNMLEQGVKDIPAAFREAQEAIASAGSVAEGNAIAFKVFGTRAGTDMAEAIRQGRFALRDYRAELGETGNAVQDTAAQTEDAAERMIKAANKLKIALAPAAGGVFGMAAGGLEGAAQLFESDAERQARMLAQYQRLQGAGATQGAAIAGQQFERQFGVSPETFAELQQLEAAAAAAREAGAALWDSWAAEAKAAAAATAGATESAVGFHAAALSLDELLQSVGSGAVDLKQALANSISAEDIGAIQAYERAMKLVDQAIAQLAPDQAAYVASLRAQGELSLAAAESERMLSDAQELRKAATDGLAESTRAAAAAERAYQQSVEGQLAALRESAVVQANATEAQRLFTKELGAGDLATKEWNTRLQSLAQTVGSTMDLNATATLQWKLAIGDTEGAIQALADATGLSMGQIRAALGATGAAFDALRAKMAAGAGPATGSYSGKGGTTGGYVGAGAPASGSYAQGALSAGSGGNFGALSAGGGGGFGDLVGAGGAITGGLRVMGDPGGTNLIRQLAYRQAVKELFGWTIDVAFDPEDFFEKTIAAETGAVRGRMAAIIDEMMRKQGPPQMGTGSGGGAYGGAGGAGGASTSAWTSQYLTSGSGPAMASTGGRSNGGWSSPPTVVVNVATTASPFVSPAETQRQAELVAREAAPYLARELGAIRGYSLT